MRESQVQPRPQGEAPEAKGAEREEVLRVLCTELVELSEGKLSLADIDPDGHLFDYGYIDSLSSVMFIEHVDRRYGVAIDDLELVETYHTLRKLADYICENR